MSRFLQLQEERNAQAARGGIIRAAPRELPPKTRGRATRVKYVPEDVPLEDINWYDYMSLERDATVDMVVNTIKLALNDATEQNFGFIALQRLEMAFTCLVQPANRAEYDKKLAREAQAKVDAENAAVAEAIARSTDISATPSQLSRMMVLQASRSAQRGGEVTCTSRSDDLDNLAEAGEPAEGSQPAVTASPTARISPKSPGQDCLDTQSSDGTRPRVQSFFIGDEEDAREFACRRKSKSRAVKEEGEDGPVAGLRPPQVDAKTAADARELDGEEHSDSEDADPTLAAFFNGGAEKGGQPVASESSTSETAEPPAEPAAETETGAPEAAEAAPPAPQRRPRWECQDCGSENAAEVLVCEMCDTPRAQSLYRHGPPWMCRVCNTDNICTSLKCGCGAPKP